jgi:hypothetical protein
MILAKIFHVIWNPDGDLHTINENRVCGELAQKLSDVPDYIRGVVVDDGVEPKEPLKTVLKKAIKERLPENMLNDKVFGGFSFSYRWEPIIDGEVFCYPTRGGTTFSLLG